MDDQKLEEWEKSRNFIIERNDINKEDLSRAIFHMYIDNKGKPYLPSEHIRGCLINGGGYIKSKVGSKAKSMKTIVAAMFMITPDIIPLNDDWIIDKRSGVNHNVKGRVIVIRPKWNDWKAKFTLSVDNDTITQETIQNIIEYGGQYVGIGSFRPEKNGMFGRFKIIKITKLNS